VEYLPTLLVKKYLKMQQRISSSCCVIFFSLTKPPSYILMENVKGFEVSQTRYTSQKIHHVSYARCARDETTNKIELQERLMNATNFVVI
jgi:hypothetical protein